MLGIDEGGDATRLLDFGQGVERKGCLARALWPVNLHNTALGVATA